MTNTRKIIFSGFGGQGILTLGQFVSTMAMHKGYNVTWLPSYGAEMRGGTANCSVIISDEPIGSPLIYSPEILVAFNKPSILKFLGRVTPGGQVVINSSIVELDKAEGLTLHKVDATNIAAALGSIRVQNMVMLGAFMKLVPLFDMDDAIALINDTFGKKYPEMVELNMQAITKGLEALNS